MSRSPPLPSPPLPLSLFLPQSRTLRRPNQRRETPPWTISQFKKSKSPAAPFPPSSSASDVDGLLFGHVTPLPTTTLSDENTSPTSPSSSTLIATVTSFFCSHSTSSFHSSSTGRVHLASLRNLVPSTSSSLLGWFSGRRRSPLRPSMRECHVTSSLSSNIQFSFQVQNSNKSYTIPPCIFLLLTTPLHDQLIDTHEYRAYQFRISDESFEAKTLDVVNLGPSFRGHYDSFCPNSGFPWMDLVAKDEIESNKGGLEEQRQMDLCAEGFDAGRLSRLVGLEAGRYTGEVEDLYRQMLAKLEGLARVVEKGSARAMEQVRIMLFIVNISFH